MNTRLRHLLAAAIAVLAPVGLLVAWLLLRGDLPDPLSTHWDLQGRVDDTLPARTLLLASLLPSVVLALLAVWFVRRSPLPPGHRASAVALVWAAWLASTVFATSAVLAAGSERAGDVDLTWWALLAVPLVPTAAAGVAHAILPAARPVVDVAGRTTPYDGTLRLSDTERVTWVGSSASRGMLLLAAVLELAAVVLVFTMWPLANLLAVVGIVVFWVHTVTVRVDDRGLSAGWGPARWPRVHVALDDVAEVGAEHVEPLAWGGWGYRATPTRTGVITRRGPGVVVERCSGRRFAVTVDDADEAAGVMAALVERRRRTASA